MKFSNKPKIIERDGVNYARIEESFEFAIKPVNEEAKKELTEGLLQEGKDDKDSIKSYVLRPKIEAIHNGITRNKTFYLADKLRGNETNRSGIHSWHHPYNKPMLTHHNSDGGEPIGRIVQSHFVSTSQRNISKSAVIIIPEITDPDAIQKVLDGRYQTVSIGANTDSVKCSVCGADLMQEGWCGHSRGENYEGVECHWIIGEVWFDECSFVNVPSDQDAGITDVGELATVELFLETGDTQESVIDLSTNKSVSISEAFNGSLVDYKPPTQPKESTEIGKEELELPEGKNPEVKEPEVLEGAKPKEASQTEENSKLDPSTAQVTISTLAKRVEELEKENTKLTEENTSLKDDNKVLSEQVSEFGHQIHLSLAEKVVDYKISLGLVEKENRETAIEESVALSKDILEYSLGDLEKLASKPRRENAKVTNPAGAVSDQPGDNVEGQDGASSSKITEEDEIETQKYLKTLFKGR